jgi:putative ABC transport system substrate-binding protein
LDRALLRRVVNAQKTLPVIAFINGATAATGEKWAASFRKGLSEAGVIEGQNATVEYYWLDGAYDRVPGLIDELVRHRVAVIATPAATQAALAAKRATSTIPIVFAVGQDPARLGLVDSLARPGGNATGINFFQAELPAKRLRLLHDLLPKAVDVALLVNPANKTTAEETLGQVQETAPSMGLQIRTGRENFSAITWVASAAPSLAPPRPLAKLDAQHGGVQFEAVNVAIKFAVKEERLESGRPSCAATGPAV